MKNKFSKISFKLSLIISLITIISTILIAIFFSIIYYNQTLSFYKNEYQQRALKISEVVKVLFTEEHHQTKNGVGSYLKNVEDIAMSDVWLIDKDMNSINTLNNKHQLNTKDLPIVLKDMINKSINSGTTSTKIINSGISGNSFSIAQPIIINDQVVGALVLNTPIKNFNDTIVIGVFTIILSGFISLIIVNILAQFLSKEITKPIIKINTMGLDLVNGNYDTTNNIKRNDEIGQLADTLNNLAYTLKQNKLKSEEVNQLKRNFISTISHELRTPITIIRGFSESLIDDVIVKEEIQATYQQILKESIYLNVLVNDLLDLSILESNAFKIETKHINIVEIINEIIFTTKKDSQKNKIKINFEYHTPELIILGDYTRIRQMLLVVVNNAIKFSFKDNIININIKDNILSIENKGNNIEAEAVPLIFNNFYTIKSNYNQNGSGLGLAIALQIANIHKIKLELAYNKNNIVIFSFDFNNVIYSP